MKIFLGADHAGFESKKTLIPYLQDLGHEVVDKGALEYDPADDYPDYIIPVAQAVARNPENYRGIVLGGSGQGEAMAANRFADIRAVVFNGQYAPGDGRDIPHEITLAREHNNANVLSLGCRFLDQLEIREAVYQWLTTPFSGDERHQRRLDKLKQIGLKI